MFGFNAKKVKNQIDEKKPISQEGEMAATMLCLGAFGIDEMERTEFAYAAVCSFGASVAKILKPGHDMATYMGRAMSVYDTVQERLVRDYYKQADNFHKMGILAGYAATVAEMIDFPDPVGDKYIKEIRKKSKA